MQLILVLVSAVCCRAGTHARKKNFLKKPAKKVCHKLLKKPYQKNIIEMHLFPPLRISFDSQFNAVSLQSTTSMAINQLVTDGRNIEIEGHVAMFLGDAFSSSCSICFWAACSSNVILYLGENIIYKNV